MSTELVTTDHQIDLPKKKKPITQEQAQKALLAAEVDKNITMVRQLARADLGNWQAENGINAGLIASSFHNLEQANRVCKTGLDIMEDKFIPPETKVKAGLMVTAAVRAARDMTQELRELAKECGMLDAKPKLKFSPPDLSITAEGDVHIHENGSK